MDTTPIPAAPPPLETAAARTDRPAGEAEDIARAEASIAAGHSATEAEVDAWVDSLGTDHELAAPDPRDPRRL